MSSSKPEKATSKPSEIGPAGNDRVNQQRFLELYGPSENGVDQSSIAETVGVEISTVENWLKHDVSFRTQYEALNRRRLDRVMEIFAENAEAIAINLCVQAKSSNRNAVRASQTIFEILGVKAAAAAFSVQVTNNTLNIQTQGDLEEAKARFAELGNILESA